MIRGSHIRTEPPSSVVVSDPSLPSVSVEVSVLVSSSVGVVMVVTRVVSSEVIVLTTVPESSVVRVVTKVVSSDVTVLMRPEASVVDAPGVSEASSVPVSSASVDSSVPVVSSLPPPIIVVAMGVVMTESPDEMVVKIVESYT